MLSKVSVRGQTVIPREMRRALGIEPGTLLRWRVQDGSLVAYPISPEPVASLGILKGKFSFEEFMRDRNEERAREREREGQQWGT